MTDIENHSENIVISTLTDEEISDLWRYAVGRGVVGIVTPLINSKRIDPNTPLDRQGTTALMLAAENPARARAARWGYTRIVEILLADGRADPNIQNKDGYTALMLAVLCGKIEIVKKLLSDKRTDPNIKNEYGETALMMAVLCGKTEIVKKLLADKRTDPNIQDECGDTALMMAVANGHTKIAEMLRAALEKKTGSPHRSTNPQQIKGNSPGLG